MAGIPLIAILLVTRTRPGPKIVFCYPPSPSTQVSGGHSRQHGSMEDSDSDSDDATMPTPLRKLVAKDSELPNTSQVDSNHDVNGHAELEGILGFSEDALEKLLSPGCWSDRQKFEVTLDNITFLGHPIYAAQDGSWTHKHTHDSTPKKSNGHELTASKSAPPRLEQDENDHDQPGIMITEPKTHVNASHDFTHIPESLDSRGGLSLGTSMNSGSTTSALAPERLQSFNLVCVMSSDSSGNKSSNVTEMHRHIIKKLSKALHYCQKHSNYVGKQSHTMTTLKSKAKLEGINKEDLSKQMVDNCELAWAMKETYEQISTGKVANIQLEGKDMSLYIPKQQRENELTLDLHNGLLLLRDKDTLLRELAGPEASALVHFLREHTPTKSVQKLVGRMVMSIDDVLSLSRYLITWERARVIAPLNSRNIYVMSPEAPLDQIEQHALDFARTFPILPSLPQILKFFRGQPLQYRSLILTRDHQAPYMAILAYLVRHRFVQQLKTSGWLRAPATVVKKTVDTTINENRRPISVASLLSPQLRPVDDDTASVSSERTAIPLSKVDALKTRTVGPHHANQNLVQTGETVEAEASKLITTPLIPSSEDMQRLQHIKDSIGDSELIDRLPSLLQYFDGEATLEDIGPREGLKRSKIDGWLSLLQREGFLMTFHHL